MDFLTSWKLFWDGYDVNKFFIGEIFRVYIADLVHGMAHLFQTAFPKTDSQVVVTKCL